MNIFKRNNSIKKIAVILSIFTLIAYHFPIFNYAIKNVEGGFNGILIIVGLATIMLAINYFIYYLLLYLGRLIGKILLSFMFIGNAITLYFINTYEVLITDKMMGNVFNTRFSEASGFFSIASILYIVTLGILPCIYIWNQKVEYGKFKKFIKNICISLLITIIAILVNIQNFTWIDRHATQLGSMLMPWSYIVNTIRYNVHVNKANRKEIKLPDAQITNKEKEVCILIIGESARKDHFSLYGYNRKTNPLLETKNVVALNATSASTYTTAGVKAILTHKATDKLYEILPNYLHRTGVDVTWRTTNWGEPPVHIEKYLKSKDIKKLYPQGDDNYDGILLEGLQNDIINCNKDKQLIILHTSTSHGPTYNKKYPADFETFKPVCTTVEMSKADHNELMNAYDNTIIYTDYLIDSTINILQQFTDRQSCVLYISDHGESLGENNLYMHGVPMLMAPKEQIEIPFIIWKSDNSLNIKKMEETSQYHIFHSILNFLDIETPIYNEELNIFEHTKL